MVCGITGRICRLDRGERKQKDRIATSIVEPETRCRQFPGMWPGPPSQSQHPFYFRTTLTNTQNTSASASHKTTNDQSPRPINMTQKAFKAFISDLLEPIEIYKLLVKDLNKDGKKDIEPTQTFTDDPPAGLGYDSLAKAQQFVQRYINSTTGNARYNIRTGKVIQLTKIENTKNVGNLALLIYRNQK